MAIEYRVTWRRRGWDASTSDQVRIFQRRHAADAFVRKLRGNGRPDLAPVTNLRLTRRQCEPWREGWR